MSSTVKRQSRKKYWAYIIVSLLMMFVIGPLCPTWSTITRMGMKMLWIFIGALVMIAGTNKMIVSCFVAFFAMIWSGYMTGDAAVSALFSSTTVVQLMFLLPFTYAMTVSGAGGVLARKIMSMKMLKGHPRLMLTVILWAALVNGVFMNSAPAVTFFLPLWDGIIDTVGYDKKSDTNRFMLTGLFCTCCLASSFLPFKGMAMSYISYFTGLMSEVGFEFNPLIWIVLLFFGVALTDAVYVFLAVSVFHMDTSRFKDFDLSSMNNKEEMSTEFNKRQMLIICSFLLCMLYSFISIFLPKGSEFTTFYNNLNLTAVVMLALGLLAMFYSREDGKSWIDLDDCMKNGVQWGPIILMAVFLLIGNSIGDSELGITDWVSELLGPILRDIPWPVFLLVAILATAVLTNFLSNFTTATLIMVALTPFASSYMEQGVNMNVLCIAISLSAMLGYLTNSAFYAAPLLLGREEMSTKFIFTKGLLMLGCYVVCMFVTCLIGGIIF